MDQQTPQTNIPEIIDPILSDKGLLNDHVGKFAIPINVDIKLYPQYISINNSKTQELLYNIQLADISEINRRKMAGTFSLKFKDNYIFIGFNASFATILFGGIGGALFSNNKKSKLWINTINEYRNSPNSSFNNGSSIS